MAEYPNYVQVNYFEPIIENLNFKTLSSQSDQGEEKRRRKWLFPKRNITLLYQILEYDNARTIWQFYIDRHGSFEVFSFFHMHDNTYIKDYVGTGDGIIKAFDVPGKDTTDRTLYLDNVALEEATDATAAGDYYIIDDGGLDNADNIQFFIAPADGDRITIDFTGLLRIRCRFMEDNLDYQQFYLRLTVMGLTLKGLLNDE